MSDTVRTEIELIIRTKDSAGKAVDYRAVIDRLVEFITDEWNITSYSLNTDDGEV